jgi:glycosyltransferase involved in cell wall biosynthesis
MINYSIIIPHKNIPHLLQRCLESIPRRDDVQIIVADDNSDAGEVDFSNFPGLNDPYVEIIFGKNENGRTGAGYARNLALERAKGKWLVFADADDFFNPCFEQALNLYKDDESNLIFFKTTSVDCFTLNTSNRAYPRNEFIEKAKMESNMDYLRYRIYAPWGKFVKRDLVVNNNIKFQEVSHSNDVVFSVRTGMKATIVSISDMLIYCLTTRNDSLEGYNSINSVDTRLKVACKCFYLLKKINKEMYAFADLYVYWSFFPIRKSIRAIPFIIWNCGIIFSLRRIFIPHYKSIIMKSLIKIVK